MNEQNNYPLTLEHVKHYLATKQEDEPVGLCLNSMACLLTETLNFTYPNVKAWRVDVGTYSNSEMAGSINLERDVDYLRKAFDFIYVGIGSGFSVPVTKVQIRERLEHLATKPEWVYGENQMPFAVSDLFPEEQSA